MSLVDIKSITLTERGQIAIPTQIREKLFRMGSKLAMLIYEDRIELRPMKQIRESMESAFATEPSLKKEWDSLEEDEAWRDL